MTRNFRCTVDYDGTAFLGFQRQPGKKTVQGALEEAMAKVLGDRVTVSAAGRTDSGVHAIGQVLQFEAITTLDAMELERAINACLPDSVAVRSLHDAAASFHARFSARSREYRYLVEYGPLAGTEPGGRTFQVPYKLSVTAMQSAASALCGTHDFVRFGSPMVRTFLLTDKLTTSTSRSGTIRTMWVAECWRQRRFVHFRFIADAFLRRMVRMIVGTLLRIGTGSLHPGAIVRLLEGDRSIFAGPAVPAHGLYLVHVRY